MCPFLEGRKLALHQLALLATVVLGMQNFALYSLIMYSCGLNANVVTAGLALLSNFHRLLLSYLQTIVVAAVLCHFRIFLTYGHKTLHLHRTAPFSILFIYNVH